MDEIFDVNERRELLLNDRTTSPALELDGMFDEFAINFALVFLNDEFVKGMRTLDETK